MGTGRFAGVMCAALQLSVPGCFSWDPTRDPASDTKPSVPVDPASDTEPSLPPSVPPGNAIVDYSTCVVENGLSNPYPWPSDCDGAPCVDGPTSEAVLSLVATALNHAGVRYYFLSAEQASADTVVLSFVVAVDWFQAFNRVAVPAALTAGEATQFVETSFCLDFPDQLVSYETVLANHRTEYLMPTPCMNRMLPDCTMGAAGTTVRQVRIDYCIGYLHTCYVDPKTGSRLSCESGASVPVPCP